MSATRFGVAFGLALLRGGPLLGSGVRPTPNTSRRACKSRRPSESSSYSSWQRTWTSAVRHRIGWGSVPAYPMVTPDAGTTWRRLPLPRTLKAGAGDVACTTPHDCLVDGGPSENAHLPVFATHDGGQTWHVIRAPLRFSRLTDVTIGPGVVVIARRFRAFVTTDEGRTWRSFRLATDFNFCGVSRPTHDDLWVTCGPYSAPSRDIVVTSGTVLLTNHDGGRTWIRRTTKMSLRPYPAAVSGNEAFTRIGVVLHPSDRRKRLMPIRASTATRIPDANAGTLPNPRPVSLQLGSSPDAPARRPSGESSCRRVA
jgi:hypothetical protein